MSETFDFKEDSDMQEAECYVHEEKWANLFDEKTKKVIIDLIQSIKSDLFAE